MQNFYSFVSTRHFFNKKIYLCFLLSFLVLLQFSFLSAQSSTKSIQNPAISNQIDRLLQQKMDPQDVELWIKMSAPNAANPGGIIEVTLKLWQTSVNTMDSIYIVYLAPNSSLKSSGELLYTKYNNALTNDGPRFESFRTATDPEGHLDSLIFFIKELPIITPNDLTQDTMIIKFQLRVDDAVEGSAALVHWVTCYQIQNDKIINRNYDAGRSDIIQKPDFEIVKTVTGNNIVSPGQEVEYQIRITNNGKNKADSVVVSDILDKSLEFLEFVPIATPDSADEKVYKGPERLLWWYFKTIPVTSTKYMRYKVRVGEITFSSMSDTVTVTNWAKIKHGETFPDSSFARIKIPPPLFKLTKQVVGNSTVGVRDTVRFRITLENLSTTAADSVFIYDQLPAELDFIEFLSPNAADFSDYIAGERRLRWFFRTFPARSTQEVNFSAFVRENIEITGESKTVYNAANAWYKGGTQAADSAQITIISPPDLVPKINSIIKPTDWKLTDGIMIGIGSAVSNEGGQTYNGSLTIKYWIERIGESAQDTITVILNPANINGGSNFLLQAQFDTLFLGGNYRLSMKIISDAGIEKIITNNQKDTLFTIEVPLRFFLSKNVYEPTKTGDQLDLIFQVPGQTEVKINIYNVAGELIKKQVDESFSTEGIYTRRWDGKNSDGNLVASGVYVCALESSAGYVTRKVIVVR